MAYLIHGSPIRLPDNAFGKDQFVSRSASSCYTNQRTDLNRMTVQVRIMLDPDPIILLQGRFAFQPPTVPRACSFGI
jgi:hypothetical protein